MNDTQRMHVPNSDYNLLNDEGRLVLSQMFILSDKLKEIFPWAQLSNYVHMSFGLNAVLELDQQGMTKYLHNAALVST